MTALAADRITTSKNIIGDKSYPVKASTKIYGGGLVGLDSGGFAIAGADAASTKIVGVAKKTADNSAVATDGAINVDVEEGDFLFAATSITQAMVGQMMYVVDDQTFDDTVGTNAVKAGKLVDFVSTTKGWIRVRAPMGVGTALADATDTTTVQALVNVLKGIINKWL